jgi:hypothetical protein
MFKYKRILRLESFKQHTIQTISLRLKKMKPTILYKDV